MGKGGVEKTGIFGYIICGRPLVRLCAPLSQQNAATCDVAAGVIIEGQPDSTTLVIIIYLRQRRRYMFLPVFVCLSVCLSVSKVTQKRVHGFR